MNQKQRIGFNLVVELATLTAVLGLIATGLVMKFVVPMAGSDALHRGWAVWGWGRHNWSTVHFYLAVGVLALLNIHLVMHWNWLCTMLHTRAKGNTKSDEPTTVLRRHGYGLAFVLVVVLMITVFVTAAFRGLRTDFGAERDMLPTLRPPSAPA